MVMASPQTSTAAAEAKASRQCELSRLGGIEALDLKVGPARRCLFGPVDHQQLQQDFARLLRTSAESAGRRWSFDFELDRPTPPAGRGSPGVEWEEVRCTDIPAFYRSRDIWCPAMGGGGDGVGSPGTPRRSRVSSSDSGSPAPSTSSGSGEEYLEVTTRGCYRHQRSTKHRQATITDFFRVKKRRLLNYKGDTWQ